jgi:hypothetical protein
MSAEIDLGHGHFGRYLSWKPDDLPANRERYGYPLPSVEKVGLAIRHNEDCESTVMFNLLEVKKWFAGEAVWQVISWEPLTLSPSIQCLRCGDHGFIRDGKWVPS